MGLDAEMVWKPTLKIMLNIDCSKLLEIDQLVPPAVRETEFQEWVIRCVL